jgi:hypothetical protein
MVVRLAGSRGATPPHSADVVSTLPTTGRGRDEYGRGRSEWRVGDLGPEERTGRPRASIRTRPSRSSFPSRGTGPRSGDRPARPPRRSPEGRGYVVGRIDGELCTAAVRVFPSIRASDRTARFIPGYRGNRSVVVVPYGPRRVVASRSRVRSRSRRLEQARSRSRRLEPATGPTAHGGSPTSAFTDQRVRPTARLSVWIETGRSGVRRPRTALGASAGSSDVEPSRLDRAPNLSRWPDRDRDRDHRRRGRQ